MAVKFVNVVNTVKLGGVRLCARERVVEGASKRSKSSSEVWSWKRAGLGLGRERKVGVL